MFKNKVTILILIDGFLQYKIGDRMVKTEKSHNPYFNRWFSAIRVLNVEMNRESVVTILILIDGFLQ